MSRQQDSKQSASQSRDLKACGKKPNCASSTSPKDSRHYFPAIKMETPEQTLALWQKLPEIMKKVPLVLQSSKQDYMHFTAHSKLLGFVDDVEFGLFEEEGVIQLRSASRVGYSDLGANKKRLQKIMKLIKGTRL